MTVKELKDKLANCDDNDEVYIANFAVSDECEYMLSNLLDLDNDVEEMTVLHMYEDSYVREECMYEDEDDIFKDRLN